MRILSSAALFLLTCALPVVTLPAQSRRPAPSTPSAPADATPIGQSAGASLVRIVALSASGDTLSQSSGVVVGVGGLVATHGYFIKPDMRLMVVDATGQSSVGATIVARDTLVDVVVLRAPGISASVARVATRAPAANDRVRLYTLRPGRSPAAVDGVITRVERFDEGALAIVAVGGDTVTSGAPFFNAQDELVALGYSSIDGGQVTNYGIPSTEFLHLVGGRRAPVVAAEAPRTTPSRVASSATSPRAPAANTTASSARAGAAKGSTLVRASLDVTGLTNAELITQLFSGEFERMSLERDAIQFGGLYQAYLDACATTCQRTLPANRVEMTVSECVTERVRTNAYGMELSRTCEEWRSRGRGLFADPILYGGLKKLEVDNMGNTLRTFVNWRMSDNGLGDMSQTLMSAVSLKDDMTRLVQINACGGPALKQFEKNLLLYSQGKQSVRVADVEDPGAVPFRESDYKRLVDDLIMVDAKKWAFNRFVPYSVSDQTVVARDAEGRPASIRGMYRYDGMGGRVSGAFTLSFSDGVPECLYYSDAPSTCRSVNRGMAYAYQTGRYWLTQEK